MQLFVGVQQRHGGHATRHTIAKQHGVVCPCDVSAG